MIKELQYKGYATEPSDYECPDGQLATSLNLINEDNQLKPVFQPSLRYTLPDHCQVVLVHNTVDFTHYIVLDTSSCSLYWFDALENEILPAIISVGDMILLHDFDEFYKVDAIGNTLVVLSSTGMHYILWQNSSYTYLGNHLPECDIAFSLVTGKTFTSDTHSVQFATARTFTDILNDLELKNQLNQAMLAAANEVVAEATQDHYFCFPFFVRYALRLFDGSVTMHSAPILLYMDTDRPVVDMGWTENGPQITGPANVKCTLDGYKLLHEVVDIAQYNELMKWKDIVSSVDVYISKQFYTYDQSASNTDLRPGTLPIKDIVPDIRDNANFFFLCHLPLDNLFVSNNANANQARPRPQNYNGVINVDFKLNNDTIVARPTLTDDYDSHDLLIPTVSYGFNARLNVAGISKRLFRGFSPKSLFFAVENQNEQETTCYVLVESDGREIILESSTVNVLFDQNGTMLWFYYPNVNARSLFVKIGDQVKGFNLTIHDYLNGAYYLGIGSSNDASASVPAAVTPDELNLVKVDNKIYTSEVNNPFFFPLLGINTVGSGDILGLSSAVKALSQGQFGQFPLYAFTTEGVWALEVSDTGTYTARQPITRDVCINANSITQIDSSVLFATDRGIMLISGSQTQCITDSIFSEAPFNVLDLSGIDQLHTRLGHVADACLPMKPFLGFLAGCRMVYDYVHQRIFVYNPTKENGTPKYTYAYVFSLKSKMWGMVFTNLASTINAYPEALAMTHDNKLVSFSETDEQVCKGLFITRPLKLEAADVQKTISTLIQRGHFQRGDVATVLYGSRDLYTWHLIWSSTDHYLRGFRGTPYKYFRIAGLATLTDGMSIFGASVDFEPRHTNQLR